MQTNSLESAYYLCRPEKCPHSAFVSGKASGASQLSLMQQYISHLFLERIPKASSHHSKTLAVGPGTAAGSVFEGENSNKANKNDDDEEAEGWDSDCETSNDLDSVIAYILALPWAENEEFIYRQVLLLISTARFSDMECIAISLAAIKEEHRNFVVAVMDHMFEQIIRGLEENDFKDAQRRVTSMKFIAECYNYKVMHSDTLFCLMYKLINWDLFADCPDKTMEKLDEP